MSSGFLYLDDGETHGYEKGVYSAVRFDYSNGEIKSKVLNSGYRTKLSYYNKITVWGVEKRPAKARLLLKGKAVELETDYDSSAQTLTIHIPDKTLGALDEFQVRLEEVVRRSETKMKGEKRPAAKVPVSHHTPAFT